MTGYGTYVRFKVKKSRKFVYIQAKQGTSKFDVTKDFATGNVDLG